TTSETEGSYRQDAGGGRVCPVSTRFFRCDQGRNGRRSRGNGRSSNRPACRRKGAAPPGGIHPDQVETGEGPPWPPTEALRPSAREVRICELNRFRSRARRDGAPFETESLAVSSSRCRF